MSTFFSTIVAEPVKGESAIVKQVLRSKGKLKRGGGGGVRVLVNVTSICAFFLVLATSSVYLGRDQSCWFITRGECVRFVFRLLINVFDVSIVQSEQRE